MKHEVGEVNATVGHPVESRGLHPTSSGEAGIRKRLVVADGERDVGPTGRSFCWGDGLATEGGSDY